MGKKKEYYLIAQNKEDNNQYYFVKINGKTKLTLEEIDEFTINFDTKEELANHLIETKELATPNYDFFFFFISNNTFSFL